MSRIAGAYPAIDVFEGRTDAAALLAGAWHKVSPFVEHLMGATFAWAGDARPKIARDPGVIAVVDGSFYNRFELSASKDLADAELMINLYRHYGFDGALSRVNGDFAVALFDVATAKLWLGRDRIGIKPLYYVHTPRGLAFASRPRALTLINGIGRDVNREFVGLFAGSHYRYIDNRPERSPYEHVLQLRAGHRLCFTDGRMEISAYWRVEEREDFAKTEENLADEYRALLLDAVRIRFADARKPAFTLSGGMDSSSVLSCAVELSGDRQHAFSTVYFEKTYDESEEIKSMLDSTVEKWHAIVVDNPDIFSTVSRMITANDEPVATVTWLSHFLLCDEASRSGFRTLFGGLGGDELNAGEYEYFPMHFADLRAEGDEQTFEREVGYWAKYHDHPIFKKNREVALALLTRCTDASNPGRAMPDRTRLERYAPVLNRDWLDLAKWQPEMPTPFRSYLKNRTFHDIFLETAPCCLRAEDRHGAAFGLTNLLPFFDYRLVEFMFRVPGTLKIRNGVTKHLLRHAMRGLLPEETRTRIKKVGWNAPGHIWFSGRTLDDTSDLVASRAFRERGIYNIEATQKIIDEHREIVSGGQVKESHMMFLWQLVNLELWLQSLDMSTK